MIARAHLIAENDDDWRDERRGVFALAGDRDAEMLGFAAGEAFKVAYWLVRKTGRATSGDEPK